MYKSTWHRIALALCSLIWLVCSCKPGIPSKYLQPSKMADILYDYHLAEGVASQTAYADTLALRAYKQSVLSKYNVSEQQFDSSMVYYTRHAKLLQGIYKSVADRLNTELVAQGGSSAGIDDLAAQGDTVGVWKYSPSLLLSPYAATCRYSFEMKTDTTYHAGDRLMLSFDTQFVYQDGVRDAAVVLAVSYDDGTTECATAVITSASHYSVQTSNSGGKHIKSVRGYWLLNNPPSADASATTLKLLFVSHIRLIRLHLKAPAANTGQESTDSLAHTEAQQSANVSTDNTEPNVGAISLKSSAANTNHPLQLRRINRTINPAIKQQ